MDPLLLPKGWGMRRPALSEMRDRSDLLDLFTIWEGPRRRGPRRYVIGVDTSDGLGLDRSAIEVLRVGTLEEPAEQVAEYVTSSVEPGPLAYIVQAIGQWYRDEDDVEAKVAIERTHHGLSTIDTLHLHLGYQNQYVWEYYDVKDPERRFSQSLGWSTTPRSRPVLIDKLRTALVTLDPITGLPDLITHSPILHDELKDFQTDGALWEAAAARGATDDCVMSLGIANIVAWRLQAGETEPIEDRRRRRSEQTALLKQAAGESARMDWRNSPATAEDVRHGVSSEDEVPLDEQLNDMRSSDHGIDDHGFGW